VALGPGFSGGVDNGLAKYVRLSVGASWRIRPIVVAALLGDTGPEAFADSFENGCVEPNNISSFAVLVS
jgi:hypothetical protein